MNNREIDALVAEKVMGWTNPWQPFFPSTEISDAWQVVEKLFATGFVLEMYGLGDRWSIDVYNFERSPKNIMVRDVEQETAPMAICLAALKAVGVEANGK